MIEFTTYKDTGEIVGSGFCQEETIALQANADAGIRVIEGAYSYKTHYVEAGIPVAMPPKPSPHHVFDYTTKRWIDPRTPESEWPIVRSERDRRLLASDWTQLPDVPLQTKEYWAVYRQALRDITLQADPFNIVWPEKPAN